MMSSRYTKQNFLKDRKSTRLNSSHGSISYAVFCLKKKKKMDIMSIRIKDKEKSLKFFYQSSRTDAPSADYFVMRSITGKYLTYAFFFFNDTATTEIYTLSLHDALPI